MKISVFSSGPRERVLQALIDSKHTVETLITTPPDKWPKVKPAVKLAKDHGITHTVVHKKAELDSLISQLKGTLCLSVGFGFIFPKAFLEAAEAQGILFLNVHGTLLPKYRGGRTLNWVIANGDRESGVTVHRIDAGIDTGPILLQKAFPLSDFETGKSLYRKTLAFEPNVVLEALDLVETGQASYTPQPTNGHAPQLPDRTPEHSLIDPSQTLETLFNQIRAADPSDYPAHFYHNGQKVCVSVWRDEKPAEETDLI